jgi:heptosyltransferase-3
MARTKGKLLVIRGGAIGDFILTLPALRALRETFADTRLELLGYPHIAALAQAGGLVDAVAPLEQRGLAAFFARGHRQEGELAAYFGGCDVIVSFLYDPDGIFQETVARCSEAQFIAGPHRPDETQNLHATEVFLRPLERLAIFGADPVPRLNVEPISAGPPETAVRGGPTIAVHPGSGSERKNWPEAHWAQLLDRVARETAATILLVGGEAEGERLSRLERALPPDRCRRLQSRPLVEVASHLQRCGAFVGHDSGITHLAAALGVRGLALWGGSNESIWRPRSPTFGVVRDPAGLTALSVERVWGDVAKLLVGA